MAATCPCRERRGVKHPFVAAPILALLLALTWFVVYGILRAGMFVLSKAWQ